MSRLRAGAHLGLLLGIVSSAAFATSGPVAKALQATGWSAGAVVLLRVAGAALVLAPATWVALRGRWGQVRRQAAPMAAYGAVAVAGCQVTYFYALQTLDVGVALLMEYSGIVLVVALVALRRRALPGPITSLGVVIALLGLALVLDIAGQARPAAIGIFWGFLAAVGLAAHYLIAARDTGLPAIALAGLGMTGGALVLAVAGLVGLVPMTFATQDLVLAGATWPWWAGIAELALIAAAVAYLLAIMAARRLGATVSSFVGLTEVLFAIAFAWLLLAELPAPIQLVGAIVLLAGVAAVKWGEAQEATRAALVEGDGAQIVDGAQVDRPADFTKSVPIA